MKYLLSSKKWGNMASFEYDENGVLTVFKVEGNINVDQIGFLAKNAVQKKFLFEELVPFLKVKDNSIEIEEVLGDLSFENFWEQYDYKKGKKSRVQKKWEAMDDANKFKALKYIKKYNFYLAERRHMEKKYPETYLNTAEWNN